MSAERRLNLQKHVPDASAAIDQVADVTAAYARAQGIDDLLKEIAVLRASQINGCASCIRVHTDRAVKAGAGVDLLMQIAVWRESGVFDERQRAALELAEAITLIHDGGISDEVYDRVGSILTEAEYAAVAWLVISINNFNRVSIIGRYPVRPRH